MTTLRSAIDQYIEKGTYVYLQSLSKDAVKSLMIGTKSRNKMGVENKPTPFALLNQDMMSQHLDVSLDSPQFIKDLPLAIKQSVKTYTNKKKNAIEVYMDFLAFLKIHYSVTVPIEYPYIYATEFDRQMYIVKAFHDQRCSISDLEEGLWTSARTINEDIRKLRNSGEISVLGQGVTMAWLNQDRVATELNSTAHPLFLMPNLTQVVVMLNGLQFMAKNESYSDFAEYLAASIWKELSEYGKQRILTVSDTLSLDKKWYEKISHMESGSLVRTEWECSNEEGSKNIVYFAKSGEECSIAYTDDEGGEQVMLDVRIITSETEDGDVRVKKNGKIYLIKKSSIRKCARDSNRLF